MNDPTKDKSPDLDFRLQSVKWFMDMNQMEFTIRIQTHENSYEEHELSIDPDDRFFEDILPEGEYSYIDEDSGLIPAVVDDHFNMHWLVKPKDLKGFIHHKVVNLQPILESIAERKYHDWK